MVVPLVFSTGVIAGILNLVPGVHRDVDGITLGAVLLAPVALAAFYARSDENGYLTMAMRGMRIVAMISMVAALTVIALIALGYLEVPKEGHVGKVSGGSVAEFLMHGAAWVSLGAFLALALAVAAPPVNEFVRWRRFGPGTEMLSRGDSTGEPDSLVSLLPPLILLAVWSVVIAVLVLFVFSR